MGELGAATDRAVDRQRVPRLRRLEHGARRHRLGHTHRVGAHATQEAGGRAGGHDLPLRAVGELPDDRRPPGHAGPRHELPGGERRAAGGDLKHRQHAAWGAVGPAADAPEERRRLAAVDAAGECGRSHAVVDRCHEVGRRRGGLAGQQVPRVGVAVAVEAARR